LTLNFAKLMWPKLSAVTRFAGQIGVDPGTPAWWEPGERDPTGRFAKIASRQYTSAWTRNRFRVDRDCLHAAKQRLPAIEKKAFGILS
jgi:hypothetical protein